MPVYEYRCGGGHHYERTEGFSAPTEHGCPHCGRSARRQLSVPAVIFKGSGFYSTDNRKSGRGNGASSSDLPDNVKTVSASAEDGHGHSHDGDHSRGNGSEPEAEAATAD